MKEIAVVTTKLETFVDWCRIKGFERISINTYIDRANLCKYICIIDMRDAYSRHFDDVIELYPYGNNSLYEICKGRCKNEKI